jgi:5-methylcytosine-specific restriction endonuclease McrA
MGSTTYQRRNDMPYKDPKDRPYKKEYAQQLARGPAEKKRRAERAAARYDYEKEHGQTDPDLVIDHKKPLSKGGSNNPSNWRLEPRKANASFSRTSNHGVKVNRPKGKR